MVNKYEKEVQVYIDKGYNFKYNFDTNLINKICIGINENGYSVENILSILRPDESITFLINHGRKNKGNFLNPSMDYNEWYDQSIYWEGNKNDGSDDRIRINTNMSDFREYMTDKIFLLNRRKKIEKILCR